MLNEPTSKIPFLTDEVQNLRQEILRHLENECIEKAYELLVKQQFIFEMNSFDMSYLRGGSGLIFIYLKTYEKTNDKALLEKSKKMILNNSERFINSSYVDCSLYSGKSGLLLVALMLYQKMESKDLEKHIEDIAKSLLSGAFIKGKSLVWFNHLQLVSEPLCSFGYGLSGIAYVLNFLNSFCHGVPLNNVINEIDNYIYDTIGTDVDYNCDYRKDILNKEQLYLHTQKYIDGDIDFFRNGTTDYSIENGWLGIAYYLTYRGLKVKTVLNNFQKHDINQLSYVIKSLEKGKEIEFSFVNSKNSTNWVNNLSSVEDNCFLLPIYEFLPLKQKLKFLDPPMVNDIVFKNNYNKLFNYLKAKSVTLKWGVKGGDDLKISILEINDEIIKTRAQSIFNYEKDFLEKRLKYIQNPYENIKTIIMENKTMSLLKISDSELISKRLIFQRKKEIKKCYSWDLENKFSEKYYMWKFNPEKGLEEYPLDVLSFIVFRFKKSKSIRQALLEIMVFCKFSKEKKLKNLIAHSNSKNKNDLINRLPFLLIYQIRLLLKDQILEFENYESRDENIKEKTIDFILKRVGAYYYR